MVRKWKARPISVDITSTSDHHDCGSTQICWSSSSLSRLQMEIYGISGEKLTGACSVFTEEHTWPCLLQRTSWYTLNGEAFTVVVCIFFWQCPIDHLKTVFPLPHMRLVPGLCFCLKSYKTKDNYIQEFISFCWYNYGRVWCIKTSQNPGGCQDCLDPGFDDKRE